MSDDRRKRHPETEAVSGGHDPGAHLGSLKPPVYETSTYVLGSAERARGLFQNAYGLEGSETVDDVGYIYARLDHPNARVAEARLSVCENSEDALVFNSGMAAISTLFLSYLTPGRTILYSRPLYGGTATLLEKFLPGWGVDTVSFTPQSTEEEILAMVAGKDLAMVYLETPANPTNDIFDIEMGARVAVASDAHLVVDNTFLSPVWQRPIDHGANFVVHSATKYLGGHSDLTAGAICASAEEIAELRHQRYRLGGTPSPQTAWLLARSLETLRLRVERQTLNAVELSEFLSRHPKVIAVNHLSLLDASDPRHETYKRQCRGPGAMISLEVAQGEEGAFRFLDSLELIHHATSLGGTESLASHPWTTSHSTWTPEQKLNIGVTEGLIRLSVGLEAIDDLVADLEQALDTV